MFARGLLSSQYYNNYHLNDDEILTAQDFIDRTLLPPSPNYITLALENYEVSYFIDNDSHAFLSLMISLEVLFKPKQYRGFSKIISDKAGILIGNSEPEIQIIQNEITRLYNKRSELVHEGKPVFHYVGEKDDVKILRHYLRESLKKIIRLNLSKDDLLEYLKI